MRTLDRLEGNIIPYFIFFHHWRTDYILDLIGTSVPGSQFVQVRLVARCSETCLGLLPDSASSARMSLYWRYSHFTTCVIYSWGWKPLSALNGNIPVAEQTTDLCACSVHGRWMARWWEVTQQSALFLAAWYQEKRMVSIAGDHSKLVSPVKCNIF